MAYNKTDAARELGISKKELENRAKAAGYDNTEQYYWSLGNFAAGSSGEYNNLGSLSGVQQSNLIAQQKAQEEDFLKRYSTAIGQQPTMADIYGRLSTQYGLPEQQNLSTGLTQNALDIEGRLQTLPERIGTETRGYDVNATQRARIEEQRGGEMAGDLAQMARAAERAGTRTAQLQGDIGTQMQLELAQQTKQLQPFTVEGELLGSRFAREVTMYTTDKEAQLNVYLQQLANNQAMTAAETAQMYALAQKEDEYEKAKSLFAFQLAEKDKYKTSNLGTLDDGW